MNEEIIMTQSAQWSIEGPTAKLRWRDGVLEQAWQITHYGGWQPGVCDGITEEWREVPQA